MIPPKLTPFFISFIYPGPIVAQVSIDSTTAGHSNTNKFKQLKEELSTPNSYRTASVLQEETIPTKSRLYNGH